MIGAWAPLVLVFTGWPSRSWLIQSRCVVQRDQQESLSASSPAYRRNRYSGKQRGGHHDRDRAWNTTDRRVRSRQNRGCPSRPGVTLARIAGIALLVLLPVPPSRE